MYLFRNYILKNFNLDWKKEKLELIELELFYLEMINEKSILSERILHRTVRDIKLIAIYYKIYDIEEFAKNFVRQFDDAFWIKIRNLQVIRGE